MAKYIGVNSTVARGIGHLVNKPVQFVDKHKKCAPFQPVSGANLLQNHIFSVDCLLCTIHKVIETSGIKNSIGWAAFKMNHWAKHTAIATKCKLITRIDKNEWSN